MQRAAIGSPTNTLAIIPNMYIHTLTHINKTPTTIYQDVEVFYIEK